MPKLLFQEARGMKSADNWGPIEELAGVLGAATACSRPVSDEGWRPHGEHTGQTGKIIAPNLYFAFGISGAIQHLAGVSSSKCIVAVNTDKDAPIFEAADYGIVGDALKVLPELISEIKAAKGMILSNTYFLAVLLVTLGVFAYTTRKYIGYFKITRGKFPVKQIGRRFGVMMEVAIGQTKIFRRPVLGLLHALVFWGFW